VEEVFAMVGPTERIAVGEREGLVRQDVLLVRVENVGGEPKEIQPKLVVDRYREPESPLAAVGLETGAGRWVRVGDRGRVVATHDVQETRLEEYEDHVDAILSLEPFRLGAGESTQFGFVVQHPGDDSTPELASLQKARRQALAFWQSADLPYDRIVVADPGIQALIDASIRNIWQSREIKNGLPAFQVGPTVYRGLWIVDGAFLLETATLLGAGHQARAGLDYMLSFQKEDGSFEIISEYWKENGIVLWACVRHALLTQDRDWLRSVWPRLERVVEAIERLRQETFENDNPLDDGLMPPGFPDGGLGERRPEYSNVYWNLAGLQAAVQGAQWLGNGEQADRWQKLFDTLRAAFETAAAQDRREDVHRNAYVPNYRGEEGRRLLPQRAQWAFCHAVYPGQVFAKGDPHVVGTLAMLEATEREGMVYGTGWNPRGLWNYFASFYGHAWLWQGRGRKAAEVLYAFANHASPLLAWREEQNLKTDTYHRVGDMPHNWASAEFIRLAIHLLALDRGDELHLFEGLPYEWAQGGMRTELKGIQTPFGSLKCSLSIDETGKQARLWISPLVSARCEEVVVHLDGWASDDPEARLLLTPHQAHERIIPILRAKPRGR
jgi:hypothetical protein